MHMYLYYACMLSEIKYCIVLYYCIAFECYKVAILFTTCQPLLCYACGTTLL